MSAADSAATPLILGLLVHASTQPKLWVRDGSSERKYRIFQLLEQLFRAGAALAGAFDQR